MINKNRDKALGTELRDKLMEPYLKMEHSLSSIDKFIEAGEKAKKALNTFNIQDLISARTPSKQQWDFLIAPSNKTQLMFDAIAEQARKRDFVRDSLIGGHTINILAQFEKTNRIQSDALKIINGIKGSILQNKDSYEAFLHTSQSISETLYPAEAINTFYNKSSIFTATNFLEGKQLNPFDLLSGAAFSNYLMVNDNMDGVSLEVEMENLNKEIANSSDFKEDVGDLANKIADINERTYVKIDEYLTDWIDKVSIKLSISKQKSYLLAVIIIFLSGHFSKEILSSRRNETNIVVNNTFNINSTYKTKQLDLIVREAPVYVKNHSTSRKLGKIRENTEVEIQRMKEGWCLIKGQVITTKKIGKKKVNNDTIIQCWISQRYLKNFQ